MKIKYKIIASVVLLLLLGISSIATISFFLQKKAATQYMEMSVRAELNDIIQQLDSVDRNVELITESYKTNYIKLAKLVRSYIENDETSLSFEKLTDIAQRVGIDEIHVIDDKGILRWGTIKEFYGFDFNTTEQTKPFLAALTQKDFELAQDPELRGIDRQLFQYIGVARQDQPGIIQIGMQPKGISELQDLFSLSSLFTNKIYGKTGYFYVIQSDGTVIAHTYPDRMSLDISKEQFFKDIMRMKTGEITYVFRDVRVHAQFKETRHGIVVAAVQVSEYLGSLEVLLRDIMIFSLIIFIFSVLIMYFITNSMTKSIKISSAAFKQLASADADLTIKIESKTKDEIQDMTNNFNGFTEKLKNIVIKLKENTIQSNDISHDLTASVEQTAAAINEIIANIASIQKQIQNVDRSVSTTGASVEQITESIDKLEKEIANQAAMVEESSASITQMMSSLNSVASITEKKTEGVEKLAQSAIKGRDQLSFTNKTFAETVVARMDTINEMAKTIESIANQTNLLSMNAAIEAAHAGEYGRGFAVVAEEIRKLADNSAKSSKEISLTLKEVMNGVAATGQSAQATSVEFDKILEEVQDTKNALMEINSNTKELTVGGQEIIKAVEELNSATANIKISSIDIAENAKQILTEQQNLTNISATVASGTAEIQTGSAEIGDAMQLVSELNHKLKEIVVSIKEETDKFKV